MSKVESIFGARSRGRFGCGFLSQRDLDDVLSSRLDVERSERLAAHLDSCEDCAHLMVAVERFRAVVDHGVLDAEARRAAVGQRRLKQRMREEFERTFGPSAKRPWSREIPTSELEHIAAAGPDVPLDPSLLDNDEDENHEP